jgi:hypothetical protein
MDRIIAPYRLCYLHTQLGVYTVGGNRRIEINPTLDRYQRQARDKLVSEQGRKLHGQRGVEVETIFGRIIQDWGFRRFTLRGMDKVKTECSLLYIDHNIAKLAVQ